MGFIRKLIGRGRAAATDPSVMESFLSRCADIYAGHPDWAETDGIRTINFARTVCAEVARLTMLGVGVSVSGGERADYIRAQLEHVFRGLRRAVELGCAYGTVILKPNGRSVDVILPGSFEITDIDGGEITGIIFTETQESGDEVWTRTENHRFSGGDYVISNKCCRGGTAASIEKSPWSGLAEEVTIEGLSHPLYAVLRMPGANNIDIASPLGMPIFADAVEELRDLDIAYSRCAKEIFDSRRTVLLDSDRLLPMNVGFRETGRGFRAAADSMGLPDYVRIVYGSGTGDVYHEINPSLSTSERLEGINALFCQIGNKCGFSGGYFVFDGRDGVKTATQVEADDRRTIELIRDVRDKVVECLDSLVYALDEWCGIYGIAPEGEVEVAYDFGDITYSRDEDRARWYGYVRDGYVSFEEFLRRFEGVTETEAAKISISSTPKTPENPEAEK